MADSLIALILFLTCAWLATAGRRVTPEDAKKRDAIITLNRALRYLLAQPDTNFDASRIIGNTVDSLRQEHWRKVLQEINRQHKTRPGSSLHRYRKHAS